MSLAAPGARQEADPVDNEQQVLRHASVALPEGLQISLPRVLHQVDVQGLTNALAMTAVPYLAGGRRDSSASTRDLVAAMPGWFAAVWAASADGTAPGSLGEGALPLTPVYGAHAGAAGHALGVLRRARERLAGCEVPRTLTHGCLCARHVIALSGHVVGVDDWSLGDPAGDPIRDLGRFAAHLAGDRLSEVLAGRSSFAAMVRQLMSETMALTPVPPRLWREVLALSQLEIAVETRLRGDPRGMLRLGHAVMALQASDRGSRGRTCGPS
jgi:hypothetical protein